MKKYLLYISTGVLLYADVHAQGIKIMSGTNLVHTGGAAYIVMADNAGLENDAPLSSSSALILKGTGSGNTELKGTGTLNVSQLEVNKTSGSIVLQKNINITDAVNFNDGLIDLNGHDILLADTAVLINESETSRVTGTAGGSVQITQLLNAPLATNPGNMGLVITSGANFGSTTIRRTHKAAINSSGGSSINRIFEIVPANNSTLGAQLRAYYFDAEVNGLDETSFDFYRSDNGGTAWTNIGSDGKDGTQNFVNINNIATMSMFTLSTSNNPLHVPGSSPLMPMHFILMENPVQEILNVTAKSNIALQLSITVYDMQGRTVVSERVAIQAGSTPFSADVKSLIPGNYFLSIKSQNAELWNAKFVKR